MTTLYGLTKQECIILSKYDTNDLALLLWNKSKASTLEGGIKKAKRIKKFAQLK